ncbi:hypothetical protein [Modestobacter sp. SYSU DS0657]
MSGSTQWQSKLLRPVLPALKAIGDRQGPQDLPESTAKTARHASSVLRCA